MRKTLQPNRFFDFTNDKIVFFFNFEHKYLIPKILHILPEYDHVKIETLMLLEKIEEKI